MSFVGMDPQPLEIYELIRGTRWFAQKNTVAASVEVCDFVDFPSCADEGPCQWMLLRVEPGGQIYSLTLQRRPDARVELISPHVFLEHVRLCGTLFTHGGGVIDYDGPPKATSTYDVLGGEESSNTVLRTTFGNMPCAVKFYRKMDGAARKEIETLASLQPSGITPKVFAHIRYKGCAEGGDELILATFIEYISGEPSYRPFQVAARKALDIVMSGHPVAQALSRPECVRPDICELIGRGIAEFHNAAMLSRSCDTHSPRLSIVDYSDGIQKKWESIATSMRSSSALSNQVTDISLRRIGAEIVGLRRRAASRQRDLSSTFGHGDMHLSHIILDCESVPCRIIDPAHSILESNASNHAATDLFQICRGFEYFAFDEAATRIETDENLSRNAASASLAGCGARLEGPRLQLMNFALEWPAVIFSHIAEAYRRVAHAALEEPLRDPFWPSLFYLSRLLSETEYNIKYDRPFFRFCDWAYLQNLANMLQKRTNLHEQECAAKTRIGAS